MSIVPGFSAWRITNWGNVSKDQDFQLGPHDVPDNFLQKGIAVSAQI